MDTKLRWRVALGTPLSVGAAYKAVDVMLASSADSTGLPSEPFWFAAVAIFLVTWWPYLRRLQVSASWPFVRTTPGEWISFSTRSTVRHRAHDQLFDFLLLQIPRATLSTTSSDPLNVELYSTWGLPGGERIRGDAINEASADVYSLDAGSPVQVKDLRYILPERKWADILPPEGNLDDLTVDVVAEDTRSGRRRTWELGSATEYTERQFQLTPLNLGIKTGRAHIGRVSVDDYDYALVVEDCVLTNRTDAPMNLTALLLVEYERGIGGAVATEPLPGVGNTPNIPFTLREPSWSGDLAFGFLPRGLAGAKPKMVTDNLVHAHVEFRDERSPGRYASKGISFRMPSSIAP